MTLACSQLKVVEGQNGVIRHLSSTLGGKDLELGLLALEELTNWLVSQFPRA